MEDKNNEPIGGGEDMVFTDGLRTGGTRIKFGHTALSKVTQDDQNHILQTIAEQVAARIQKNPSPEVLKTFEADLRKRIEENAEVLSWDTDYEEIVRRVRDLLRRRS